MTIIDGSYFVNSPCMVYREDEFLNNFTPLEEENLRKYKYVGDKIDEYKNGILLKRLKSNSINKIFIQENNNIHIINKFK